jgi:hypothetical protein
VEVGDVYAMMAWGSGEAGRWSDVVKYASQGEQTVGVAINSRLHVLAWLTEGSFRVGDWHVAARSYLEVTDMLDERRDDPPYYLFQAYAIMALIHTLRGERAHADRLMDLLLRVEASTGHHTVRRTWSYVNRLLVARGQLDEAWARFQQPPAGWRLAGAAHLEAMCEWVPAAGAWDRAGEIEREVRAVADDGDLVGSHLFADRLAGLAACHTGDIEQGVATLGRARAGFRDNGAIWEAARTDLAIAEALAPRGLDADRWTHLEEARALFEELGSVAELRRAGWLIEPGTRPD